MTNNFGRTFEKVYPITDEVEIIHCVHEGYCPSCGAEGEVTTNPANWVAAWLEWQCYKLECPNGHVHYAEPNESGTDWGGW